MATGALLHGVSIAIQVVIHVLTLSHGTVIPQPALVLEPYTAIAIVLRKQAAQFVQLQLHGTVTLNQNVLHLREPGAVAHGALVILALVDLSMKFSL